VQQRAG